MDCNEIRTRNHLLCKRTLKHLAKLAKNRKQSVEFTLKRVRDMIRTYSPWNGVCKFMKIKNNEPFRATQYIITQYICILYHFGTLCIKGVSGVTVNKN